MSDLTRRSFLAAAGAIVAQPALGAARQKSPGKRRSGVDVVIIGAGAAGIAAARRVMSAGRTCIVLEAAGVVGGRCLTDTALFGVPYDRGAHAFYTPESNPVARLALQSGFDIYPAPRGQRMRITRRYARESEMEDLLATMVRANGAIADAARKSDVSTAQVLQKDLGEWRSTVEFMLGPYLCGKDVSDISAVDLARAAERDVQAYCRQGLGAVIAKLAAGVPVKLSTPATRINWRVRAGVEVETAQGTIGARAAIVTASTNVLAAEKLRFAPDLPKRQVEAIEQLKLGSYDHVALELSDNPLGLRTDEFVFERSSSARTGVLLANIAGSTLCTIDVGGRFGRELAGKGATEMVAFALDWLDNLYGSALKRAAGRSHATNWNEEPWVLGAMSAAAPGGQLARRTLMESVNNRVWFAGEAVHERLWGTVGGAWESGDRAAQAALRVIAPPAAVPKQPRQPRRRQRAR
ncbi:MAG: NAD(P)-binding protein [Rhizobiales bacterium]|nr:NAD(P)-binding protein [Hyphomicrobiales bacterium]